MSQLAEKRAADVFRDLSSRSARLGEVAQLAVQHSLELIATAQRARKLTQRTSS